MDAPAGRGVAAGAWRPRYGRAVISQEKPPAPSDPPPAIRMLGDRLLVRLDAESAERRLSSGIVIPATAVPGRKLAWAVVTAAGRGIRQVGVGDRVLFDPADRAEVELSSIVYMVLREKDVHAIARPEADGEGTGLYL